MKNIIFIALILGLFLVPSLVLADSGSLDQYGGHECQNNCLLLGLEKGQYHYHDIPTDPNYLLGQIKMPSLPEIFYLPFIKLNELTNVQSSIANNQEQLNGLTQNPEIDARFCEGSEVFGKGWYDNLNRARIKPVCANGESIIKSKPEIKATDYYKQLPGLASDIVTRVYHYITTKGRNVFTDKPDISELKDKIAQGQTDPMLYYVNRYDDPLTLRPIKEEKAVALYGANYKDQIVYFDDSIVYSYKIGKPLY